MGLPFRQPEQGQFEGASETGIDWLAGAETERVSITLDAGCLCRLLREHQLYVQDFSCVDDASRACVRRLLLTLLTNGG